MLETSWYAINNGGFRSEELNVLGHHEPARQIMTIQISRLTSAWLESVDELMKKNSQTLGFLPKEALQSYLEKNNVIGAISDDDNLVGYLLFGANSEYFRITHLCVVEEYQGQGIARKLVNKLIESVSTQKAIKLNCRRDYPVNDLWPKLGFTAVDEKRSRAREEHFLTRWQLILALDEQLQLFQAKTSDDTLDVIIDAQIFFDFYEPDSDKTKPSKALLSDFLVDSLSLWVTSELFNEINRQNNRERREKSWDRAQTFFQLESTPYLVKEFSELLKDILPGGRPSRESDIRHLAKAAASSVKTFVTRDHALLQNSEDIARLTGLEVINPVGLIVRMHELVEKQTYTPDRIAGLDLRWERLKSGDLVSFPFNAFLERQETKGKFRERLESLLAEPDRFMCELLKANDKIIAIRVLTNNFKKWLTSPLARLAHSADRSLYGRFLIADTISNAVGKNLEMVRFEVSSIAPSLIPDLLELGFIECNNNFVRFCFSWSARREEIWPAIAKLCPECTDRCQVMSNLELEQCCSPLSVTPATQKYFLIPIRPGYAISLIDTDESGYDLFGGNPDVLLLWNNVYYRSATRHKMLKAPGRILWYVSKDKQQIIAVSRLDEVVIDTPKELLRKFKKFGILKWHHLYEMCGKDPSKRLMALKFSHTFLFREPVSLSEVRDVFKKNKKAGPSTQAPSELPPQIFRELFQRGFPSIS